MFNAKMIQDTESLM